MDPIHRSVLVPTLAALLALAGCGTDRTRYVDVTRTEPVAITSGTGAYQVQFIPGPQSVMGKSTFQLAVLERPALTPATGLTITVHPVMYMTGAMPMQHSAPADVVKESTTAGTYDAAIYYLMASSLTEGYWNVTATIDDGTVVEDVTFGPWVDMPMGTDTVRKNLWGPSDVGMSAMDTNKYFLFRDGPVTAAAGVLPIHLSRAEEMLMTFKAVHLDAVLAGTGAVTAVALEASADDAFTTPITASHVADGHWTVSLASLGLVKGTARTVYLRLSVNGEAKTADGLAAAGTNDWVAFTVTPQ
jgi:hypothetical protein